MKKIMNPLKKFINFKANIKIRINERIKMKRSMDKELRDEKDQMGVAHVKNHSSETG